MFKVPALAVLTVLLLAGCESEEDPTLYDHYLQDYAKELIPLGYQNSWEYNVEYYDPITKQTSTYVETEINNNVGQFMSDHTITVWDSLTSSWVYYGLGYKFIHDGFRYLTHAPLMYTPYHEGNEKGLLCGFYTEGNNDGQYWFKLPRKPVKPLAYQIKRTFIHEERVPDDTTWSLYSASFDTTIYQIKVPAGIYDCYRLLLSYMGQIGVGGKFYDCYHNTIYLAPGVGVVKRELSTTHFQIPEDSLRLQSRYKYELVKFEKH